jgi:DNA-binding response OmpR family regulator
MGNVIYLTGRDQPAGIVLVESDPLARIAAASHLRKAGLTVLEAIDGAEVLRLLRARRTLSLVLGELDRSDHGFDLVAALRREFPTVKLLLGCARDTGTVPQIGLATVARPYDLRMVERAVKALLGDASERN